MTRSTVKKLNESLEEPEREMHRLRKAASHQQRNESLVIAGRNLFDNKASSSANSGPKPTSHLKACERIPPPIQLACANSKDKMSKIQSITSNTSIQVITSQADRATRDASDFA
ncbi:hypothetical protein Tco_1376412 [Tanacetum coccineum]